MSRTAGSEAMKDALELTSWQAVKDTLELTFMASREGCAGAYLHGESKGLSP